METLFLRKVFTIKGLVLKVCLCETNIWRENKYENYKPFVVDKVLKELIVWIETHSSIEAFS